MRSPVSPEIKNLLDRERVIPPISASQRARAMARARASLATAAAIPLVPSGATPRTRWAAAAAAALVVSAAVGAAAYEIRARMAPLPATRPAAVAPRSEVVARVPAASPLAGAVGVPTPVTIGQAPALSPMEADRAELRLLRRARVAVARGDFATALSPIAEHARRFKNGRLAEEREALRVKALAGLGRTEEARRAAAAFRARFPRSVLRPAVSEMPTSAP